MKPNRKVLKWVLWFIALATAVVIYLWHEDQENAKKVVKLEKQKIILQSLMMAHNPPWTNVEFELIPLKDVIIARGTVENQTELDELRQKLLNSGVPVSIYVDAMDTNSKK
jgi:hypothetical protein